MFIEITDGNGEVRLININHIIWARPSSTETTEILLTDGSKIYTHESIKSLMEGIE